MTNLNFSLIIFLAQWVLIFLIAMIFYAKFLREKREKIKEKELNVAVIRKKTGKGDTDLDVLYNLLKERKKIKIPIIAKNFKISKEKALDWCKILENYNLVSIDYPPFSEPVVEIKIKEEKRGEYEEAKEEKKPEKEQRQATFKKSWENRKRKKKRKKR